MRYEIPVPASLKMSMNDRMHWAPKSRLTRQLRAVAFAGCRDQRVPKQSERVSVGLVWYTKDNRRRDPGNSYPMVKALVDGVVEAGVVPDDTSMWVLEHPTEHVLAIDKVERFTFWVETFDQFGEDAA